MGCELEEKGKFQNEVDEGMESIPRDERWVIGEDFNGHVREGNICDDEVMAGFLMDGNGCSVHFFLKRVGT